MVIVSPVFGWAAIISFVPPSFLVFSGQARYYEINISLPFLLWLRWAVWFATAFLTNPLRAQDWAHTSIIWHHSSLGLFYIFPIFPPLRWVCFPYFFVTSYFHSILLSRRKHAFNYISLPDYTWGIWGERWVSIPVYQISNTKHWQSRSFYRKPAR